MDDHLHTKRAVNWSNETRVGHFSAQITSTAQALLLADENQCLECSLPSLGPDLRPSAHHSKPLGTMNQHPLTTFMHSHPEIMHDGLYCQNLSPDTSFAWQHTGLLAALFSTLPRAPMYELRLDIGRLNLLISRSSVLL